MIMSKLRHASSVRKGIDHIENNLPCQDNVYYMNENGIHVMALSDGAGSKAYSQIGSEIVTKEVCQYLIKEFDALQIVGEKYGKTQEEIEENNKVIKSSIFNYLKKRLLEKVNLSNGEFTLEDLACTLLFVAIKNGRYIMGHIGDGVIGGLFNSGASSSLRVLSHPENGAQINITFFLTDPDAEDHFRISLGNFNNLSGIILMSDGPEEVLYHPINGLHVNCLKLFRNFDNYTTKSYTEILNKFLDTQVAKYSYDDLSLNILYLAKADMKNAKTVLIEDYFSDITCTEQIIQKSQYAIFLDNSRKYKKVDDLSHITGINEKE